MFLGEKVRYFLTDNYGHEWIVDQFDSGREIREGEVAIYVASDTIHLIHDNR